MSSPISCPAAVMPTAELVRDLGADPVQARLHLGAPALTFGPGKLEIPDQGRLLLALGLHALRQQRDPDGCADREQQAKRVDPTR